MDKKILIVAGVLVAAGALAALLFLHTSVPRSTTPTAQGVNAPEGALVITLTPDGFVPSENTIAQGQTVTFKNTTGKPFWPASNLHPSHLLYPEFDPKQPIDANDTWSFTFDKPGSWRFHDHLAPYFTGTITVTPAP